MGKKLTHSFVKKEFKKRKFILLEPYISIDIPRKTRCIKHNRIFMVTPYALLHLERGCDKCGKEKYFNARAYSYDEVKEYIESLGGKLLDKEYRGNKFPLHVLCPFGHECFSAFADILHNKWCTECRIINIGKQNALPFDAVTERIESRGGTLISTEYKNSKTKLDILCTNGHRFCMTLDLISRGSWCHSCTKWIMQKRVEVILEDLLKSKSESNYRGFVWLKTDEKYIQRMEVDFWFSKWKLAGEYQGEQHFIPICFGGITEKQAKINLKGQKERDRIKKKKIKQNSNEIEYFIIFTYKEKDKLTKEYVLQKLRAAGVPI